MTELEFITEGVFYDYLLGKGYLPEAIKREIQVGKIWLDYIIVDLHTGNIIEIYEIKAEFINKREYNFQLVENIRQHIPYYEEIQKYIVTFDPKDSSFLVREMNKSCQSFSAFHKILEQFPAEEGRRMFFRGHSDSMAYRLKPSIYRELPRSPFDTGAKPVAVAREHILYREAIRRCPEDFEKCGSTFEFLEKMQHYAVPTRLLDITSNPLVALYFACYEHPDRDGEVYFFTVEEKDIKYFDSDTVSVISNLARLGSISLDKAEEGADPDEGIQRLLHEIRYEKPHFRNMIRREDMEKVACVLPKLNNPRIIRQQGAFFLYGMDGSKQNQAGFTYRFRRFLIDKNGKKKILKDLSLLGFDESTLFPELDAVANHLARNDC